MQKLANARQLAEKAMKDKNKPDKGIMFVRSNTTTDEELGEMTKTVNPDEINIDENYSTDEDEEVEEVQAQTVPTEVFGGLVQEDD